MILVFGFNNRTCQNVLESIRALNNPNIELRYIGSGLRIFRNFAQELSTKDYDAIIGIGATNRGSYTRSETTCSNMFRRTLLSHGPATYTLPRLPISEPIREGNNIGNSYCNAVAYAVMHIARPKNFTYLHVPKKATATHLATYVSLHAYQLYS